MPKKKEEKDPEVDVSTAPKKKQSFTTVWFNDYAVNNKTELKAVCDLTARSAYEQFKINVPSNNTEIYGVIFYATFASILDFIRSKQKTYNCFTMEVMKSINIGYTNNDDDENEKVGNFMPIMEFIGVNQKVVSTTEDPNRIDPDVSADSLNRWRQANSKKNIEYYKEIQENAYNRLRVDYHVGLRTSEAAIPLFCIFMDNIISVLKQKFHEAEGTDVSEVSMNVFGLFDAFYSYDPDEAKEIIEFQPNIMMKLALKDDHNATHD